MKFDELILHPRAKKGLESWLENPAQTTILSGNRGVGLGTIAKTLAREIAGANIKIVEPRAHKNQKTISINIDDVRALVQLARGKNARKFVIVIDEAEKMPAYSSGAALKIFEEPPKNLFFILTTHSLAQIPATIFSRARKIEIPPAKVPDGFFDEILPATKRAQMKFLAEKLPAEATRIKNDDEYFREQAGKMADARKFLEGDEIEKMAVAANTSGREAAAALVGNLAEFLARKPGKNFAKNAEILSETAENLAKNANVRAQLLALALNLR